MLYVIYYISHTYVYIHTYLLIRPASTAYLYVITYIVYFILYIIYDILYCMHTFS